MSKIEDKNKLCQSCKYDCYVAPFVNVITCKATKEDKEFAKLAIELIKKYDKGGIKK